MTKEQELPLHLAVMNVRVELQKCNLKKSGKNKFGGFEYFELADFMPSLNELMLRFGICDNFSIDDKKVILILSNGDETITYKLPFEHFETPLNKSNQKQMQDIQYFGALDTYYKRYIYMNAFGITDGDVIDAMDNNSLQENKNAQRAKVQSPKISKEIAAAYNQAIQETIERTGKNDGSVMGWFLKHLNVAKVTDITLEQTAQADMLIEKLKAGK